MAQAEDTLSPSGHTTKTVTGVMNTIEDVQRRVHDIRHMVKQWQNLRQERKKYFKKGQRIKGHDDLNRNTMTYLQQKTKHQDEEIGSLYEILCATLELQNDEMRILMQTVEDVTKWLPEASRKFVLKDSKESPRTVDEERRHTATNSNETNHEEKCKRKLTDRNEDNRFKILDEQTNKIDRKAKATRQIAELEDFKDGHSLAKRVEDHSATVNHLCANCQKEIPENLKKTEAVVPIQPAKPIPETIYVSSDMWRSCACDEVFKVKELRSKSPITGQCTVLCLDISESMEGVAWTQMKAFVTAYLQYTEKMSIIKGVHENVAMVTFGHETSVVHHASTDYRKLKASLDKLTPGGPSPMFAGLLFAEAAATEASFEEKGFTIFPRVVLITDGKATPADKIAGPDQYLGMFDFVTPSQVEQRAKILGYNSCRLSIIPVGTDTNTDFLKRLAEVTYGRLLDAKEDQDQFCRSFGNYMVAVKIMAQHGRLLINFATLEFAARLEEPELTSADMGDVRWYFVQVHQHVAEEEDDKYSDTESLRLPKVGTRVRRGPEWSEFDDNDENGPGTIVGGRPNSCVRVLWDCGGGGIYTYGGENGVFQVVIADDIRDNSDGVGPGTLVKRGPQWNGGDEDGGPESIGVIVRAKLYEIVNVRWQNGLTKPYKYGFGGQYEVQQCDAEDVQRFKSMTKDQMQTDYLPHYSLSSDQLEMREHPQTVTMDDLLGVSCVDEGRDAEEPEQIELGSALHSLLTQNTTENDIEEEQFQRMEPRKRRNKNAPVENKRPDVMRDIHEEDKSMARVREEITPSSATDTGQKYLKTSAMSDRNGVLEIIPLGGTQKTSPKSSSLDILGINEQNKRNSHAYAATLEEMNAQNKAVKTEHTPSHVWQYREHDRWQNYPADLNLRIERSFKSNPKSTLLVTIEGEKYRILLSKLQQIHVQTKQTTEIQRIGS